MPMLPMLSNVSWSHWRQYFGDECDLKNLSILRADNFERLSSYRFHTPSRHYCYTSNILFMREMRCMFHDNKDTLVCKSRNKLVFTQVLRQVSLERWTRDPTKEPGLVRYSGQKRETGGPLDEINNGGRGSRKEKERKREVNILPRGMNNLHSLEFK